MKPPLRLEKTSTWALGTLPQFFVMRPVHHEGRMLS